MAEEGKLYAVPDSDLIAIADRARLMSGTNKPLSIKEIIYWLGKVAYIPQGWVSSAFALDFGPNVLNGIALDNVVKTTATSSFMLSFESRAIESIEE